MEADTGGKEGNDGVVVMVCVCNINSKYEPISRG